MSGTPMPTIESRLATVEAILRRLDADINGNGKPGLKDDVAEVKSDQKSFADRWIQREEDKKLYDNHASNRQKFLISLALLILALLAFFGIQARLSHSAFVSVDNPSVTAQNGSQHAGDSEIPR